MVNIKLCLFDEDEKQPLRLNPSLSVAHAWGGMELACLRATSDIDYPLSGDTLKWKEELFLQASHLIGHLIVETITSNV